MVMSFWRTCVYAFVCLGATTTATLAQATSPERTLVGHVVDASGASIAGATVTLVGPPDIRTTTDATGAFRIVVPANEAPALTVTARGFADYREATVGTSANAVFVRLAPLGDGANAAASPQPCVSGVTDANTSSVGESSPCSPLRTIGRISTTGRNVNLVGKAISASTGTIDQEQIATRPLLRPGEVLEDIPGLVISQHSGGGKANQYYLRGFQLDHGTNLEAVVNGVPVNLGSHAHGQGYSDVNYLIPELVSFVEFKKGTYFADQGDFAVVGGYDLRYRNTIAPTTSFTAGDFGYDRLLTASSLKLGPGDLLYAVEVAHDNGSYLKPDQYHRYNGVLKYSRTQSPNDFSLTGIAYNGAFDSTDQIPQRLVDSGALSRYGYIDPSDGGNTYRYALSSQFTHTDPNGTTKFNAYGVNSLLNLFSNFTYYYDDASDYYNVTQNPVTCNAAYVACTPNTGTAPRTNSYVSYCPANNTAPPGAAPHSVRLAPFTFGCGDQRQQVDKRLYYGFDTSRSFVTPRSETTVGVGLRNDNAPVVGLYLDHGKQMYANGILSNDHVVDTSEYAYLQTRLSIGSKFRVTPGLRFDHYNYNVASFITANSGAANEGVLDPKLALSYAMTPHDEFYADFGESFHSNDARGVIGTEDPQTRGAFDPTGAPSQFNSPLTRASGYELGYRYSSPKLTTTFSAFRLLLSNELIFDGDHGTTSVGGPDVRQGLEIANFFTPTKWLTLDADLATTTARFTSDPFNQGTGVPESLAAVISSGATIDTRRYAASLRLRYFGPRQLDQTGDASSPPSLLFNTQLTAKLPHRTAVTLDVFNLLNARVADVTYNYGSWLPSDAANPAYAKNPAIDPTVGGGGVNDDHFHPSQARTVRLTLTTGL